MNRITFTILLALLGIMLFVPVARAANSLFELGGEKAPILGQGKTEEKSLVDCAKAGDCSVQHIFLLANNIIRWIVGVAGAVALFMYIMGGMWMIFSGGNSGRIERGKDILIGTSVALVFILTSWLIVNFVLRSLGAKNEYTLTGVTCGPNDDCTEGKICYEKKCQEQCYVKIQLFEKDTNKQWSCKAPTSCGQPLQTVAECQSATNCVPSLCSDPNTVCCY